MTPSEAGNGGRLRAEAALRAAAIVAAHQLPRGGFASFLRRGEGEPTICVSVPVTAQACCWLHQAEQQASRSRVSVGGLDLTARETAWLRRTVEDTLRRAQDFLAWQQESDGSWRRLGRLSDRPADGCTSALATMALLPRTQPARSEALLKRRWAAVSRLQATLDGEGDGESLLAGGSASAPLFAVATARLRSLLGMPSGPERARVESALQALVDGDDPPDGVALRFLQATLEAVREGALSLGDDERHDVRRLVESAAAAEREELSRCLALLSLQDLADQAPWSPSLAGLERSLIEALAAEVGRAGEVWLEDDVHSPALLASGALAAFTRTSATGVPR